MSYFILVLIYTASPKLNPYKAYTKFKAIHYLGILIFFLHSYRFFNYDLLKPERELRNTMKKCKCKSCFRSQVVHYVDTDEYLENKVMYIAIDIDRNCGCKSINADALDSDIDVFYLYFIK